jgi:hypothetical protein
MPTLANPFDPIAVPDLLPWSEQFAHTLVPEWAGMPVYTININLAGCWGLSDPFLDLTYQDRIRNWQGRGVCVALDLKAMRKWVRATRRYRPAWEEHFRWTAIAVLIHELAHVLEQPAPFAEPRKVWTPKERQKGIRAELGTRVLDPLETSPLTLLQHPAPFIRLAGHLCHRAERLGVSIPFGSVAAGEDYGLSTGIEYAATLRDEAEAMAGETFAAIKATKPPRDFVALWRVDVLAWGARIANPNDFQLAAAAAALSIFPKESEV